MECQRPIRLNSGMNPGWVMGIAVWLVGTAGLADGWVAVVPEPPDQAKQAGGFELGRCEVTVGEFAAYLNAVGATDFPETTQIMPSVGGGYTVQNGRVRQAVAEVTPADAEAYCRWCSQQEGRMIRLPTETEWETAARGGVNGAPYPWGWGGNPSKLARFATNGPAGRGGLFPANGFGLYDMAGNLYEWCATDPDDPPDRRVARGGSWAERDPARLEVTHRQLFPADYRDRDVGFRVLREPLKEE